jgi:hypothetical protein
MSGSPIFGLMRERAKGIMEMCSGKIREATDKLSPRQRIVLLVILFATFVAVDIIYIVQGFRGGNPDTLNVQHLQRVEIKTSNPNRNDTIRRK